MSETAYATTSPVYYRDEDISGGFTTFEDDGGGAEDDAPSGDGGDDSNDSGGEDPYRSPEGSEDDARRDFTKPLSPRELSERFLPGNAFSTEEIFGLFAALAESSMAQRQGFLDASLAHQRAVENASPAAILQEIRPRVTDIRRELQNAFGAVSRRLGPQGGGQAKRENASALSQAAQALQNEFAGAQLRGTAKHYGTLTGFRPALASQLPQPTEEVTPFDPVPLARSFAGALGAGVRAWNTPSGGQPQTTQPDLVNDPSPYAGAPYGGMRDF